MQAWMGEQLHRSERRLGSRVQDRRRAGGEGEDPLRGQLPHTHPDDVSDEAALLTGDLLSTGYWAADIGDIEEGDTVAVVGAGPAGICCAMMARAMGAGRIVLIDVDRTRLYSRRGVSPAPLSEPDVRLSAHRALQ